ncbi:uncharacterized protein LOC115670224 isoform X2 [Syzygium oleosum]|uniref:uncharacterized protein LOC115670224 isoform X2 n=1 Tax=Syzygium oleosum TaxID=219896 RepID=UPI0024BA88EC|nr:uncharacterized protein LOC115670224 isoform X2 [Syzygium oleosum]
MRALLHCRHHHHHHHPLRSPIPLANMSSLSLPLPSSAASSPRCLLLLAAAAAAPDPSFKPSLFLRLSGAPRNGSPGLRLGKVGRRSRAFMGVSAGTQKAVDDGLFLDYKSSTAFLFPGQGAQAVGMGKDSQSVPAAAELYKKANDILGFEDGLKLVKLRGEAMQEAADAARSAMVSVIGLDSEKVQLLCDAANEEVDDENKVQIANYLCTGNYSVSGGLKGIEAVEAKAKSFKARMTVRLAVAGAFHTSFMKPAVSRLEAALAATEIKTPRIPVISNVDAKPHADPDTIKRILANQVTSPVQWETTIKTLLTKGLKKSYELGPGKVIAGIVKRMDKTAEVENIGA